MERNHQTENTAALAAATAEAFGTKPRIVQVGCQDMQPALRRGDFVLALPVDRFVHDGLYVLDIHQRNVPDVWYAASLGPHGINLRKVRSDLTPNERVSREEFAAMVVGMVIAKINVLEGRYFPYPAN